MKKKRISIDIDLTMTKLSKTHRKLLFFDIIVVQKEDYL